MKRFYPQTVFTTGHGLYEQGLPVDWFGLPPGEAASSAYRSQSRLWENLGGRSPEFWEWCYPLARKFPRSLMTLHQIHWQKR